MIYHKRIANQWDINLDLDEEKDINGMIAVTIGMNMVTGVEM